MQTKEFKAESKRLLDMMINSIYTHKEIFLREIISNASDAIDKLYFKSLTDTSVGMKKSDFAINIAIDKENRTLTVSDNGIGMTEEDLENNLGTIANSGSFAFKKDNDLGDDVDIIGQFGVGFYSTFMVAKEVTVVTKAFGSDQAYKWTSDGVEGYTIEECDKPDGVGTTITLKLKDDTDDEKYSTYLDQYQIQSLVKKYSDYIRFPIRMEVEHTHYNEEGKEPEVHKAIETLNSMTPIWKKNKSELKDEDYNNFYMEKFGDYEPPVAHIHSKNEGVATYDALLYIPARAPFDYYSKDYEKGLQLYSSGVMIMEKCADLLPDWFSFVKGVVDSEDLSLNISRELLQQDRQLKIIAKNLEKSIKNELAKLLKNDREKYEKFYGAFGTQLKYGVLNDYGAKKELLQDLLLYWSAKENKLVSLKEYADAMPEAQKYIYYASAESRDRAAKLPQIETLREKGFDVLLMTDEVDGFVPGERVKEVKLSDALGSHPVCVVPGEGMTFEMEKYFKRVSPEMDMKAEKVLELNASHPMFAKLQIAVAQEPEKAKKIVEILYAQALLMADLPLEDPGAYSDLVCELLG